MEKKYDLIDTIVSIWNFKFLYLSFFVLIYFLIYYFFLVDGNAYKSSLKFKQSNPVAIKNFDSSSSDLFLLFIQNLNSLEGFSDTQSSLSKSNLDMELYESLYQSAELDSDNYIHSIRSINTNISPDTLKQFHLMLFETINTKIVTNEIDEVIMPKIDSIKNELKVFNAISSSDIDIDSISQNNIFVLDTRAENYEIVKLKARLYDLEYKLNKLKIASSNSNYVIEYYPEQIIIQSLNNFNLIIIFGFIVSLLISAILTALYSIIYKRIN